ncbi:MAG: ABC transporter permease subunit [Spirochaetaceae bacterium]
MNREKKSEQIILKGKPPRWALTVNLQLYILLLPTLIIYALFRYWPMYGIQIAFKDYNPFLGFTKSSWVGFFHFIRFFNSYQFWKVLFNTIGLSFFQLIAGFPMPIILALMLHQVDNKRYKKVVQTVTYAPHFISLVVLVGLISIFLSPRTGIINTIIVQFGGDPVYFLGKEGLFKPIYVLSGIWQNTGYGAIIYMAALSGIDPQLYEAAKIDGANRFHRMIHIDLPGILPTVVIILILNVGKIMKVGFEKVFLMQNPLNLSSSEIISTYVYKMGILQAQFSFSTAVDLFNGVINLIILLSANKIAKKLSNSSLW